MTSWLISAPVWGAIYARHFIQAALPSQRAALHHAGLTARWIVHTDQADMIRPEMADLDVEFRSVPRGADRYAQFGDAHRECLASAQTGEYVALLTADIVVSRETFAACTTRFGEGKKAIVAAASRTLGRTYPLIDATAPDLLDWTMDWRHPMIMACFWGQPSNTPWAVYFRHDGRTILRGFHLHPLAVVKDRSIPFKGTLDQDLLTNFRHSEIHVVTDRHELAMAEISPADRNISLRRRAMTPESIADWARTRALPVHRWLSTHRIVIQGDDGPGPDQDIWPKVLALLQ